MALRVEAAAEPIPGYRLIDRIGGGGFGEVWRAEAPGGLHKAIKIIHGDLRSVDADGARHAEQELRALKRLQGIRHPYLLSLERYDVVDGRLLIVSELADCNMWDRFKECRNQGLLGIPRGELLRYLEEAAEVLDMMSNQYQLQHLDIKPQNLFLVYSHVKVADFGLVKDLEGMQGVITGGVTPVYAAPETFNQQITPFCDQYSLAIVYQEMLTGVRPFNGTSGQQLLMQHLTQSPNLGPLPPADRPAVGRAMSKKPDERYPSCLEFVRTLIQSGEYATPHQPGNGGSATRVETPMSTSKTLPPMPPLNHSTGGSSYRGHAPGNPSVLTGRRLPDPQPPMETPRTELRSRIEDSQLMRSSLSMSEIYVPQRNAPPEVTGEGVIAPTIVIGLGGLGYEAIRQFKLKVQNRYGSLDRIPTLKLMLIDTDSETLHQCTDVDGVLATGEVLPARLNRAAHYMKPRRNGRSLIEGWFDPQMLYKIPRNPATLGIRSIGRLAFLDHFRGIAEKIASSIESTTQPDALSTAERLTKLGLRSNRPKVYVVCGLGGGTGSGMFLDAAYVARHKLRQQGYLNPEVIGVFLLPAAERGTKGPALSNAYTALRELNHYSQPDTAYSAHYEEREGVVNDPTPPFSRVMVLPQPAGSKAGQPPTANRNENVQRAAQFLERETLSMIGRAVDESRPADRDGMDEEFSVTTFGQAAYEWPRALLVSRTSQWMSSSVLGRWLDSDPATIGQFVKSWLDQRWQLEELSGEFLVSKLQQVGEKYFGQSPEALFAAEAQPYVQKGWFTKEPDPAKLWQTFSRLQQLVGMPDERVMQRQVGQVEHHIDTAADTLARDQGPKYFRLAVTLLEHPDYRLTGAEEAVRQIIQKIDETIKQYELMAGDLSGQSIQAFYVVHNYLNAERNQKRPSPAEVADALRTFPTWRFQCLVLRQAGRLLLNFKTQLTDQLRELSFCRQRLDVVRNSFLKVGNQDIPQKEMLLLPSGIATFDAALEALQNSFTADDIRAFDKKLQVKIEQEFNALFNVCLSSVNMMGSLYSTIDDQAKQFVAPRLGQMETASMFFARFPDVQAASKSVGWLNAQAEPPLKLPPSDTTETTIVAVPGGQHGESVKQMVEYALPTPPAEILSGDDEVLIYREYSHIPLTALPQLGPLGEDAYNAALDAGNPHIRIDVPTWQDVEVC